jgi:alpha-amylase
VDLVFCPELNLTLLAGDDGKRFYDFEGVLGSGPRMKTSGEVEEASWFSLVDQHQRLRLYLELNPPATLWRHPVESVSQSEDGFERIYQGSAIIPKWELTIPSQMSSKVALRLEVQSQEEEAVVPLEEPEG